MSPLRNLPPWLWAPAVLVTDFCTKRVVLAQADALRGGVRVIGDYARFGYVRNPGAAMGLFHNGRWLLIGVSVVTSLLLIWLYARGPRDQRLRLAALAAILGGALGNLVDRIFYHGLVVDFIDLGVGVHRFYTFNVADMGVTLGGAALFLAVLAESRAGRREPADPAAPPAPAPSPPAAAAAPAVVAEPETAPPADHHG
ncbi:MAG: signal peptidase II [Candidatus Krumholzibacteriia bacterium]